jgi:cytidyltransferase-like protein
MRHIVAILSGYFNPLHIGHIEYMKRAREISDNVVVIINNDKQRELKGSKPFQNQDERMKIIESLRMVDMTVLSVDEDKTVCKTLESLHEHYKEHHPKYTLYFVNGGDQFSSNIPERETCNRLGILMVDGLGGKIQSSSWLLENEKNI